MPAWVWGDLAEPFPFRGNLLSTAWLLKSQSRWEGWKWFKWVVLCVPKLWSHWSVFSARANSSSWWGVTKLTKQGLLVLHILDGASQGVYLARKEEWE